MRTISTLLLAGLLLSLLAGPVAAADRATADFVVVGVDEVIEEDLYAVGNSVDVRGTIDGDLIAFSGTEVRISGLVTGDVIAITGEVVVEGEVAGSVRATAGSVVISGSVGKDAVVVAGSTDLTGRVSGDVLAWGWALNLAGTVDGFVNGQMIGTTRISGDIGRDFEMTVGRLEILEGTNVDGDLGYRAPEPATVDEAAEVGGQLIQRRPTRQNIRVRAVALIGAVLGVLVFLGGGLLILWSSPRLMEAARNAVQSNPVKSVSAGLLVLPTPLIVPGIIAAIVGTADPDVAFPFAIALVPVAVGAAGLFAIFVVVSPVPVLTAAGKRFLPDRSDFLAFLVAALVFLLLLSIPVVRWLVVGIVVILGLGSWLVAGSTTRRREPIDQ